MTNNFSFLILVFIFICVLYVDEVRSVCFRNGERFAGLQVLTTGSSQGGQDSPRRSVKIPEVRAAHAKSRRLSKTLVRPRWSTSTARSSPASAS